MESVPSQLRDHLDEDEYLITRNDAQGKITYLNGRWVHVTGYELSALIGASTKILYHEDMPEEVGADVWATLSRKRTWTGLQKLRRADGSAFWALTTVTPDLRNRVVAGYISVRTRAAPDQIALADVVYTQWKFGRGGRYKLREGAIVSRGSFRGPWSMFGLSPQKCVIAVLAGLATGAAAALLQRLCLSTSSVATLNSVLAGVAAGVIAATVDVKATLDALIDDSVPLTN